MHLYKLYQVVYKLYQEHHFKSSHNGGYQGPYRRCHCIQPFRQPRKKSHSGSDMRQCSRVVSKKRNHSISSHNSLYSFIALLLTLSM